VNAGDVVGITFGNRKLEVRVLSVQEVKRKQEAADLYEIVSETRIEDPAY
jgi:ribosomal 50S subunit-recycling heat shock protein